MRHAVSLLAGITLNMIGAGMIQADEPKPNEVDTKPPKKFLNHLVGEKSPYLIQHVANPVDWYPWGEKAFAKARKENKPILLSIGYSTCHWCHVMERESFKSKEVAEFLNKHFVAIKVDREERPDVDKIYMTAYQAMYQNGGGWPLNMFLTPELKPFAGGTYFPPKDRPGRMSFLSVLKKLSKAWADQGPEVVMSANKIHADMSRIFEQGGAKDGQLTLKDLDIATAALVNGADTTNGGWGQGPKFPQVSHMRYLLRQWQRTGNVEARDHVILTCNKMMEGGIHDHLAGGFHRYAVDGKWLVPHFEKMLYDQAQLLDLYLDVWLITQDHRYKNVAVNLSNYVLREMQHSEGGFYCAQDAGSEGKEGKCFCWTLSEMKKILNKEELKIAVRWFGITEQGNFIDHSDPEPLPNQNVLHIAEPNWKVSENDKTLLESALRKMRVVRAARIPASTDDKVLADWNGMMIASLSRAGRVLGDQRYLSASIKAHAFVKSKLWDGKLLYHRWRDGERDSSHQASSYLQMIAGSLGLYQSTLDPSYLNFAVRLAEGARILFYDEVKGGFFLGTKRDDLLLRLKDDFDGATPTASSVGAMQYLKLARITGRGDFLKVAEKTLSSTATAVQQSPYTMAWMMCVADMKLGKSARLVIAGQDKQAEFLNARYQFYAPRLLCMGNAGKVDTFTAGLKPIDGKTAAYYCVGETCRAPVTDPAKLVKVLKAEQSVKMAKPEKIKEPETPSNQGE